MNSQLSSFKPLSFLENLLDCSLESLDTNSMKNKNKWIIELKEIKVRQPFAPKQKAFKNKKAYNRQSFKLAFA